MSGGANDVNDPVEVGGVASFVPPPLHELNESLVFEHV
jgi:hypothetical protein